jgi:hypothetical protein
MPKLAKAQMRQRDRIETAASYVMTARVRLKQVALRCRQAMQRYPLEDLLEPAARGLEATLQDLDTMHGLLRQAWREGEQQKWLE